MKWVFAAIVLTVMWGLVGIPLACNVSTSCDGWERGELGTALHGSLFGWVTMALVISWMKTFRGDDW